MKMFNYWWHNLCVAPTVWLYLLPVNKVQNYCLVFQNMNSQVHYQNPVLYLSELIYQMKTELDWVRKIKRISIKSLLSCVFHIRFIHSCHKCLVDGIQLESHGSRTGHGYMGSHSIWRLQYFCLGCKNR